MTTLSTHLRIAIYEIPPNEEAYLCQSALTGHDLFFHPEPLKAANLPLAKDAEVLSVFIYSRIGKAELEQMPQLKLIATRSTGFDHILRHRENVVITPHSAFNSREALSRILDTTVANILAFAAGKSINIVRD
jgi:lactate dehydrogenase-like 2-hydroxyacid dehydrogenase